MTSYPACLWRVRLQNVCKPERDAPPASNPRGPARCSAERSSTRLCITVGGEAPANVPVFTFRTIEPTLPLAAGMTSAKESWSQGSGDSQILGPPLSASGLTTGIPSGQQAARACDQEPLTAQELTKNSVGDETEQGRILRQAGLTNETPLWYYILKESEVRRNGNRLGPVGSYLVGETIHAALRSDPQSILNQPDDCPPIWQLPDGPSRIYGFSELFRLAKSM